MEDNTDQIAAMRFLLRWLRDEVKINSESLTRDTLARHLGINRDKLGKFLNQKLKREESKRFEELKAPLRKLLAMVEEWPGPVSQLVQEIYGVDDAQTVGPVVDIPRVIRHFALAEVLEAKNNPNIEQLYGLNVLIRLANETVPAPELRKDAMLPGWSVALLNVPPPHVQSGDHHPVFKIRQRGKNANAPLDIEGIIAIQQGRLILQGIDVQEKRPFNATLTIAGDWESYRDQTLERKVVGSGVMLGLSSSKSPFGSLFEIFAVPETRLTSNSTQAEILKFREIYKAAVDQVIGVRNLQETIKILKLIGVDAEAEKLREMRERSEGAAPLKPF